MIHLNQFKTKLQLLLKNLKHIVIFLKKMTLKHCYLWLNPNKQKRVSTEATLAGILESLEVKEIKSSWELTDGFHQIRLKSNSYKLKMKESKYMLTLWQLKFKKPCLNKQNQRSFYKILKMLLNKLKQTQKSRELIILKLNQIEMMKMPQQNRLSSFSRNKLLFGLEVIDYNQQSYQQKQHFGVLKQYSYLFINVFELDRKS
ncbi:unnamed protein product [Paramecium pentaurelia]|uniref:Uncharacterized protein n=1 Tax=Paramecium pentaurelia TaxID=43138 RepID=A0A8S1VT45_9CILI|nr:unnamed protein product [Paramecium pentaurelia]